MASGKVRKVLVLDSLCLPPEPPFHWTLTVALCGHAGEFQRWVTITSIVFIWVIFLLRLVGTQQIDIFETWRKK